MKPRDQFKTAFLSTTATGSYSVQRGKAPIDLWLDANEGPAPPVDILNIEPQQVRRYPSKLNLESMLAERIGVDAGQVVVTNGGDDAIDRVCRGFLSAGQNIVMTTPSFEMIRTYALLADADVRQVRWWDGEFPWREFEGLFDEGTRVAAVVSPNNPTGMCVDAMAVVELASRHPDVLVLFDLAYVEFADQDAQAVVRSAPNIVTIRTFSKAFGLAGLRVGYAVGSVGVANVLRSAGGPYPVSAMSLSVAQRALETVDATALVRRIAVERAELHACFAESGVRTTPSQANFVFANVGNGAWFRDAMAGLGIGVRAWQDRGELDEWTRITCPGNAEDFARLRGGIRTVLRPEALVFDMDGVLVDVTGSYRQAIILTAASFGVTIGPGDIAAVKARGNANNDWSVTQILLAEAGVHADLAEVRDRFEAHYQGDQERPGLWRSETPLVTRHWLSDLKEQGYAVGVVTGRPRHDAERVIDYFGWSGLFEAMVCMEDGPLKPDPWSVKEVLRRMNVRYAWMFGDTPDDQRASRGAQVVPVGVLAPGDDDEESLYANGAAFVVDTVTKALSLLPERT